MCDGLLLQVMRKEKILQNDYADYVRSERDVLTSVSHPYIVTLRFSFQVCSTLRLAPCSPHSCCSVVSHHKAQAIAVAYAGRHTPHLTAMSDAGLRPTACLVLRRHPPNFTLSWTG